MEKLKRFRYFSGLKRFFFAAAVTAAAVTLLAGCTTSVDGGSDAFDTRAKQVVTGVHTMLNDELYTKMYTSSGDVLDAVGQYKEFDPSAPTAVYQIEIGKSEVKKIFEAQGIDYDGLSDFMRERVEITLPSTVMSMAPASRAGNTALAVSSIFNYGISFVDKSIKEPAIFVYVYGNKAFTVSFTPGTEDDIVGCTARILPLGADDFASAEALRSVFSEEIDINVKKVK